jgi:hypothetical protein
LTGIFRACKPFRQLSAVLGAFKIRPIWVWEVDLIRTLVVGCKVWQFIESWRASRGFSPRFETGGACFKTKQEMDCNDSSEQSPPRRPIATRQTRTGIPPFRSARTGRPQGSFRQSPPVLRYPPRCLYTLIFVRRLHLLASALQSSLPGTLDAQPASNDPPL